MLPSGELAPERITLYKMTALAINTPATWPLQAPTTWEPAEKPDLGRSSTETVPESKLSDGSEGLWEPEEAGTTEVSVDIDTAHRRLQQQRDRNRL